MRQIILLASLFLAQFGFSQDQIGFDGFGDIRIGKTNKELKKKIKVVEDAPEYAWFAPLSLDYYINEFGLDSASTVSMMEEMSAMDEMEDQNSILCTFKKEGDQSIHGLQIECAKLIFENDKLAAIMLVMEPSTVDSESKLLFLDHLSQIFGETWCSYSVNFEDPPFYCGWDDEASGNSIVVSDMMEPGGAPGKSLNLTFGN